MIQIRWLVPVVKAGIFANPKLQYRQEEQVDDYGRGRYTQWGEWVDVPHVVEDEQ